MAWNPNVPNVTNRVQDDLAAVRENFQHLAPLAPYIQALLSSRIVDHNLDTGSSNGYYIRYANGLQVCWKTGLLAQYNDSNRLATGWVFPAEFADADYSLSLMPAWVSGDIVNYSTVGRGFYIDLVTKNTDGVGIWILVSSANSEDTIHVDALAVGRWAES